MDGHYRRSKGNAGIEGVQFQVGITAVFLLNALRYLRDWRISTENKDAGKFDDVVIEFSDGSAVLLQAKHKESKRISKDQLLSTNSKNVDFSLPKYFLSYQEIRSKFNVKNIIICTNADVDKKKLKDVVDVQQASSDSILYLEGEDCSFVTFKENILSDLRANSEIYYDINLRSKSMGKEEISDRNLRDFLERLQFFTHYPSSGKLRKAIHDKLLPMLTDCKLWRGTSYNEIYGKVEDWFKQGGGEYLTESLANAMFCEIKSDQFCKTLKDYDVSFISTDFGLEEEKRIFHVSVERGYLLQALKTFHALHEQMTALFVNPDDGVEVYKQVIEAFRLPKYKWLILIFHQIFNQNLIREILFMLNDILDTCSYKKVVLIGNKQNVQQSVLKDVIFEINGTVKFSNLAPTCREKLVRKANINYQGKRTTLKELLGASLDEYYDKALDSEELEKLVRGEEITVGASLGSLDPNTVGYYINRTIEREVNKEDMEIWSGTTRKDRYTEEDIFEVKEKFIIISDCAGMGKSTVLANLAENMKKIYPSLWIIRIELNEYSGILRDFRRRRKRTIKITELLDSNTTTRIKSVLERFVFSMNKKVVVMFDGFDEISPDYTELVLSLLSQCQEPNFVKVFVTTRPHMNKELENLLRVKPFLLQPFTTEDQIAFLTNYWKHHLRLEDSERDKCEQYAMALINKMSSWVKAKLNFTAIPLQVRMLAEIFQEKWEEKDNVEWEGCKEFLVGAKQEPELPEQMKICELYETFIEIKWNILLDKANPTGTASGNSAHEFQSDKCFKNHQSFALQEILNNEAIHDKEIRHLFSRFQYDKDMEPRMLKIGIVQMTNGRLEFVHKTFSEYFVAKSILELSELEQGTFNQDVIFQQFFIDEILCNPQLTVVRAFLESALEDIVDSLPANILEKYRNLVTADPKSQKQRSELLHLLAFEGHVSILKLILKSMNLKKNTSKNIFKTFTDDGNNTLKHLEGLVEHYGIDIEDELGNTPLLFAAEGGHLNMIRYLVRQGASINSRNYAGGSAMHLVAEKGHLDVCKFFVERGLDSNLRNKNGISALHWSSAEGHLNIVKWLVGCGHADINIENNDGFTALHCAAQGGHLDVCKFLIEGGADVNFRNKNGVSVLHSASFKGHLELIKWLVEKGQANVNVANNDDTTVLYAAAEGGHLDVCKFLVERGVDVNLRDKNCIFVLYSAAGNGHLELVKWLVECGHADVNIANNDGFTSLHFACQEGHLEVCKFLVEGGVDVNLRNKYGVSVLHTAARSGHLDVVKWLVERGHADVNATDKKSSTALHIVAQEGHLEVCKFLVEGGVDVNHRDEHGISALHCASFEGHLNVVKWLVEYGHADINVASNDGCTVLQFAAEKGQLDVCKFFIEAGLDANLRNKNGVTALHWASLGGHLDVVKWLIECKHSDVNVVNNDGCTALHDAALEGHLPVCKFLVELSVHVNVHNKNGHSALHLAATRGHLDVVKLLVECGHVDVNAADNDDFTVLHSAAQEGHLDICKFLLELGVDATLPNRNGISALHSAAGRGHTKVVKWLVECGHANVNAADNDGFTALHQAAQKGYLEVCKFLVDGDVDVNLRNKNGFSALHWASSKGHLDVVNYLVECGHADVNAANNDGLTVLHTAAQGGHLNVCKFLIEAGVDANVRNKNGLSVLHLASFEGNLELVKWLIECGHADVNVTNNAGFTVLHCAAQGGHLNLCQFLVERGVDANLRNKNGFSALYSAVGCGHLELVKLLVGCGHADVNVANNEGFTVLHCAAQEGHMNVCKFLVNEGVYVNLRSKEGISVLHSAARSGRIDIVKWLVECGHADVNEATNNGSTALHFAAQGGHLEMCKFLVEGGIDVNLCHKNGFTALHLAVLEGQLDVTKFLVAAGADVNIRSSDGFSALQTATQRGHLLIVEFLAETGRTNNTGHNS